MGDDKEHWDLGCESPLRRQRPHLAVISGIPGASSYPSGLASTPERKDEPPACTNTHFLQPSFVCWGVIPIRGMQLGAHLTP